MCLRYMLRGRLAVHLWRERWTPQVVPEGRSARPLFRVRFPGAAVRVAVVVAAPLYGQSLAGALLKNTLPLCAARMVPGLAFVRFVLVLPGSSPGRGFSFVRLPYIT